MKHYHILTALCGEQDSQAALLTLDSAAADSIRAARTACIQFKEEHGGTPSLNHIGAYQIHFLNGIPSGFVEDMEPDDLSVLYEQPILLEDLDETTFLEAADQQNLYQPSETTGLKIYADHIYIVGLEKHCDDRIESHEISTLILTALDPFAKWETTPSEEEEDEDDSPDCTTCTDATCAWCQAEKQATA